MSKSFGSKELVKCVEEFGFKYHSANAHHVKYYPPSGKVPPGGIRPFYMIQLGRKTYDPVSAARYISELKKFGYTKEEIEKNIK